MLSTSEKQACIQACGALAPLGESGAMVLAELMAEQGYGAGTEVFGLGDAATHVYVIAEGSVSVFTGGSGTAVRQMGPGEILGEYGLVAGSRRTSRVTADEDCILLAMDYERFRNFLHQFPELMYHLLELAVSRMTALEKEARRNA